MDGELGFCYPQIAKTLRGFLSEVSHLKSRRDRMPFSYPEEGKKDRLMDLEGDFFGG